MPKQHVFLSYCRDNAEEVRRLHDDLISAGEQVWWDKDILAGQDWQMEIRKAMRDAYAVVLCLSEETGKRTMSGIYPEALDAIAAYRKYAAGNIYLIPVKLSACEIPLIEIDATRTLDRLQCVDLFPPEKWVVGLGKLVEALQAAPLHPTAGQSPSTPQPTATAPSPAASLQGGPSKASQSAQAQGSHPVEPQIAVSRLPNTGEFLIGRDHQLQQLDQAWENPKTNIVQIVAPGGVGKTQLVTRWRQRFVQRDFVEPVRVYDWSFYSQGVSNEAASAEAFFDSALSWFGETEPTRLKDPWQKGERLAQLVRASQTLLILDGLEPLQHPPGPLAGELTDPTLKALLRGLADRNSGLCLITTREAVVELESVPQPTHIKVDLMTLEPGSGAKLLRKYKVTGTQEELEQASADYEGHALALILLGTYLRDRYGGDIWARNRVALGASAADGNALDMAELLKGKERMARHARKVIQSYVVWFERDEDADAVSRAAVTILRLMGLFNRPADSGCLEVLRAEPIPGLTDPLFAWNDRHELWNKAVQRLREGRLLAGASSTDAQTSTLEAHPLVREHFATQLTAQYPDETCEAHRRLYDHLKQVAPELPDTLQAMIPLYHAVAHGGKAGLWQATLDDVFWARIQRQAESFSTRKLGAMGTDLAALAALFEVPFTLPNSTLTETDQAYVLNKASFRLRALGRLAEATQPMQAALDRYVDIDEWKYSAVQASNLSELYLTLGDVAAAVRVGEQSVELSDRSGDLFQRMSKRTTLADALRQAARLQSTQLAFSEAEALQAELQPQDPLLYSVRGAQYCDLLLERGLLEQDAFIPSRSDRTAEVGTVKVEPSAWLTRCREVRDRAEKALEIAKSNNWLLDIGLDNLTLGQTYLLEATLRFKDAVEPSTPADLAALLQQAAHHFDRSVSLLRQSGQQQYLPLGLLARAALWRVNSKFKIQSATLEADEYLGKARRDLTEVEQIAGRSGMLIYQIEAALERCRLALSLGDRAQAQAKLEEAKALVKRTERPYEPHVPDWDEWEPPVYVGVFKAGEIVGYHRRNGEIAELAVEIGLE
ncbi:MAG: TIR domain-containing protein [Leptolyngbyaceae cyanobacterium MO_188.B28]|nr:TIR domain-containing protein [Leptolyngbyaceae cyanobacterium MO_188.B28]